ncbi:hypothetical protein Pelo_15927 [Pelomyxa schiedti]|nr:hypothetical protein Pelo_15927 [Pelomyxa schiedti]
MSLSQPNASRPKNLSLKMITEIHVNGVPCEAVGLRGGVFSPSHHQLLQQQQQFVQVVTVYCPARARTNSGTTGAQPGVDDEILSREVFHTFTDFEILHANLQMRDLPKQNLYNAIQSEPLLEDMRQQLNAFLLQTLSDFCSLLANPAAISEDMKDKIRTFLKFLTNGQELPPSASTATAMRPNVPSHFIPPNPATPPLQPLPSSPTPTPPIPTPNFLQPASAIPTFPQPSVTPNFPQPTLAPNFPQPTLTNPNFPQTSIPTQKFPQPSSCNSPNFPQPTASPFTTQTMQQASQEGQDDYEFLMELCENLRVKTERWLWKKLVIGIFGVTSAGKSAFINHVFTIPVTRSAIGVCDTKFTIFETVPLPEFQKICGQTDFRRFSREELMRELPSTDMDVNRDPRLNQVFCHLDSFKTLERYRYQLRDQRQLFERLHNLRAVIINEQYIYSASSKDCQLPKRIILIDSKGLDQKNNTQESILPQIATMQLFIRMADFSLFMMPAAEIHNSIGQISLFEQCKLYAIEGEQFVRTLQTHGKVNNIPATRDSGGSGGGWGLLGSVGSLAASAVKLLYSDGNSTSRGASTASNTGTVGVNNSQWDKVFFVLTKMDVLARDCAVKNKPVQEAEQEISYALGNLFGHTLLSEPPPFSQCYSIGLPEFHAGTNIPPFSNDLSTLKDIFLHTSNTSFARRRDEVILQLCDQLIAEYKRKPYHQNVLDRIGDFYRGNSTLDRLQKIKEATLARARMGF